MIKIIKWLARLARTRVRLGLGPEVEGWRAWARFWRSYRRYRRLRARAGERDVLHLMPQVGEDRAVTEMEPIYFYQDAWAFERIVGCRPASHVDVGSHHKFVALLSKVVPLTMIDIRPLQLPLSSIQFKKGDILQLPFEDGTVESLSSLCVVEHIGLGRYGDRLDVQGTEKAIQELKRVVVPGGDLYLSIPINGVPATFFNAQRLFTEQYLFSLFYPFELVQSRYIYGDHFGEE